MPEVLAYMAPPPRSRKWLFYCLLAVALWGVWGVVGTAAQARMSPMTVQVISTAGVVPAGLLLLAAPGLLRRPEGPRKTSRLLGCVYAFGVGLCGSVGNIFMLQAINRGGDASTVYPLTGMFPLVTVALAVP